MTVVELDVQENDCGCVVVTADEIDLLTMEPDVALLVADLLTIAAERAGR
jgi:hypothetical protein